MNILSINYEVSSARQIEFISDSTFLDADILLWDIDKTFSEIKGRLKHKSKAEGGVVSFFEEADFINIEKILGTRKQNFQEFLNHDRILLVQTPINGKQEFLIADKSNNTRKGVIDLLSLLDINDLRIIVERGEFVTLSENNILRKFSHNGRLIFKYESKFNRLIGEPLLYINKTNYPVAQLIQRNHGNIFIIPPLLFNEPITYQTFINGVIALKDLIPEKKVSSTEFVLPVWAEEFLLKGEDVETKKLDGYKNELADITQRIENQVVALRHFTKLKLLIAGSGTELEDICKEVFKTIGFNIHETEFNRDDLIISFEGRIAVVEIKGVKGSASEKNASQLEKWVSNYIDKNEITPKGILLVNAFKDTPILERNEKPFPDQMLTYSTKRDHCLMTGSDLLNLFMDFKEGKLTSQQIAALLFETVGVLKSNKS